MKPQRSQRKTLCPQKTEKKRDLETWKIDSLIRDEVIFEGKGWRIITLGSLWLGFDNTL